LALVRSRRVSGLFARRTRPLALPLGTLLCNALPGSGWFPQTKSQTGLRTSEATDIRRGFLADGLTVLHHFNGLAVSCVLFSSV